MKIKAFTFVEVMVSLVILAFITLITISGFKGAIEKTNELKEKNVIKSIKSALSTLADSPMYYPLDDDFTNLNEASFGNDNFAIGYSKFRDLLTYEIGAFSNGKQNCYIYKTDFETQLFDACYETNNGVLVGIPDTDFINTNLVSINDEGTHYSQYLPITLYVNKQKAAKSDYYLDAILYGIRRDGAIIPIEIPQR